MTKPAPKQSAAPLDWLPLSAMEEWAGNPKQHPVENVAEIAASLRRFGFLSPIVVWGSRRRIVSGHGRYRAAQTRMKADPGLYLDAAAPGPGMVPVRVVEFADESEAAAYALADNRLTEKNPMLPVDVEAVLRQIRDEGGDVQVPGWSEGEIAAILAGAGIDPEAALGSGDGSGAYTQKIKIPVYEPTMDKPPPIRDLYNTEKASALKKRIDAAKLPADVASFLRAAADRHTSFHFKNIAEFYAHATPEVQQLMEESALVIIDMDSAIEKGFVKLTERLTELAGLENSDEE